MREDLLLGGKVRLMQPESGLRASSDAVLLAASVAASPGARVLELGSGSGAVALCLAARRPDLQICGWDIQADLVALAQRNATLNGWPDRVQFQHRDVLAPLRPDAGQGWDHVVSNPPFYDGDSTDPSADPQRRRAMMEADLVGWLRCAAHLLVHRGRLTMIFRADRLDDLLAALRRDFGGIIVLPLWPRVGQAAKRVLVQASRGSRAPLTLLPGAVLHGDGHGYRPEIDAVLRHGAPFGFADQD